MKLLRFLIPLALLAAPLHAEDRSPAQRLLDAMDFEATAAAAAKTSFTPVIEKFKTQGLPPEATAELSVAADELFKKTAASPEFRGAVAKLYEERFTADELEELIRFYKSPVGHKAAVAQPEIMNEAARLGKNYTQVNALEFQGKVQGILKKYNAARKDGAPAPELKKDKARETPKPDDAGPH